MTKLTRINIPASEDWATIQVPSGSELVWAAWFYGGSVGGPGLPQPEPKTISTYWRSEDFSSGTEPCAIRRDVLPDPESQHPGGNAGIYGASSFITAANIFLWWKKGAPLPQFPTSTAAE